MTLTLLKVSKSYRDGSCLRPIITELTIHFPKRGLVYVVGPSGCGKSTLVNLMAGITKPDWGKVALNEKNIAAISGYRRDYVALVYQNINLIDCLTLKQNVILACRVKGIRFDPLRYARLTSQLEVSGLSSRYPQQVSGGQRQRFGVIRALMGATPILILDEPTGSCDRTSAKLIKRTLEQSARNHLVIIVTHDCSLVKGGQVIDFNQLETSYDFRLARYSWVNRNPTRMALPLVYWIRQFYHDINKYILIIASQIVIAITIAIMIVSFFAFGDYYRTADLSLPGRQVVTVEKLEGEFSRQELQNLEQDYHLAGFNEPLDLNGLGLTLAGRNLDFGSIQISRANPHLMITSGRNIAKKGEILINQAFLAKQSGMGATLENRRLGIEFEIVGVVADCYHSYPMVYFDYQFLGLDMSQESGVEPGRINLVLNANSSLETAMTSLDRNYYCFSDYQNTIESHQTILKLGYLVAGVFIVVALIIGVILYELVLEAIFWSRRVSAALLISMGQSKIMIMGQMVFEIVLVTVLITWGASGISNLIIRFINTKGLIREWFGLNLPLETDSQAVFILGAIYLGVGLIAALMQLRRILSLDISEILKEE